MDSVPAVAVVSYPTAKFTEELVTRTLHALYPSLSVIRALPDDTPPNTRILQWTGYDQTEHARTLEHPLAVLASSYTIRKALIRKHFLHRWVQAHVAKEPHSVLAAGVPRTWDVELAWADELDEMWSDDLYELGQLLDAGSNTWWILKPGMADRGMGIRLFDTKERLQAVFESFEDASSDGSHDSSEEANDDTRVATSQLRHFVIQEYLAEPVLVDPLQTIRTNDSPADVREGRKFHLRAYCVSSGALTLYLFPRILALFASMSYAPPSHETCDDLTPHLTNTCLQPGAGEMNVRLLAELSGCAYGGSANGTLRVDDIAEIETQTAALLAETFRAALASPIHFQPLPNAFELFGADLLVSHARGGGFSVSLLELNAEPAIELTGPRLHWILDELFAGIACACVRPFWSDASAEADADWAVGETRHGLRKCLEVEVRSKAAW